MPSSATSDAAIADLQRQLAASRQTNTRLETELSSVKSELAAARSSVAAANRSRPRTPPPPAPPPPPLPQAPASPGLKAALEFVSAARQTVRQELPVVNGSEADWTVSAALKGDDFHGPPSFKVGAKSTAYYPLDFTPQWVCEREGELVLTNTATGDKYVFTLKGTGEEPLAEAHHVLECQARQPQTLSLKVFNVAADGAPCGSHLFNMARGGIVVEDDAAACLQVPPRHARDTTATRTRRRVHGAGMSHHRHMHTPPLVISSC